MIEALDKTDLAQRNSTKPYIDDFFTQFEKLNQAKGANLKLASQKFWNSKIK